VLVLLLASAVAADNELVTRRVCAQVGFAADSIVLGEAIQPRTGSGRCRLARRRRAAAVHAPGALARLRAIARPLLRLLAIMTLGYLVTVELAKRRFYGEPRGT
jgi:hypothetical protein